MYPGNWQWFEQHRAELDARRRNELRVKQFLKRIESLPPTQPSA